MTHSAADLGIVPMQPSTLTYSPEQLISESIRRWYHDRLNHDLGAITCCLIDQKVVIVVEQTITQPEKFLAECGQAHLAEQIRLNVDEAIESHLIALVERVTQTAVVDLLISTRIETERTGGIAVLAEIPESISANPDN